MKKFTFRIGFLSVFVFSFFAVSQVLGASDLLERGFEQAKRYDKVVDIGSNKNAVGGEVFKKTSEISITKKCFVDDNVIYVDGATKEEKEQNCTAKTAICQAGDSIVFVGFKPDGSLNVGGCFYNDQKVIISGANNDELSKNCSERNALSVTGGVVTFLGLKPDGTINDLGYTTLSGTRTNGTWKPGNCSFGTLRNGTWKMDGYSTQDPLIVRITKFVLNITVALAITMIIVSGVRYIMALGNEGQQKKQRSLIANIVIGLLIALASWGIIELLRAVTQSSINLN